jgi:hypothetical protein
MAFNIIAETNRKLDYNELHDEIYSDELKFDFVPMPGFGIAGGDAIGICVPMREANESTWTQLEPVLKKLRRRFGCDVYDMYGGQKLGLLNITAFKKNLLG